MKNIIYGLGAATLAIILIMTIVTVNNQMTRRKEMQSSLSNAVEQSVDTLMRTKAYNINSREEFVADVLQNLLITYESKAEIKVDIMSADVEKGLLGIRVTEYYQNPNKKSNSITCDKIVIFDTASTILYKIIYTDENGMLESEYEIKEGDNLHCPAKNVFWYLYNSTDNKNLKQYSKSEIEAITITGDNYKDLKEPDGNTIHFYANKDLIK